MNVNDNTRKERLAQAIANEVVKGGRVESQGDFNAVIRFGGKGVNHVLHLILTLITLGAWSLVWIAVWIIVTVSKKTVTLSVDEYGNVLRQRV